MKMRKHKNGSVISEKDDCFVFLKEGLFIVFMCVCVYMHIHTYVTHIVEVIGHLVGVISLL